MAEHDGTKHSWWLSLPGVLTAIAGLITAVGGLILALNTANLLPHANQVATRPTAAIPISSPVDTKPTAVIPTSQQFIEIYRSRFFDALGKPSGSGANQAYTQIKQAGGLDGEIRTLLGELESQVVAKAEPPKSDQERSDVKNFIALFQRAAHDAKRARDKLDAYYLLLVYAYLTNQAEFEEREGDFKNLATARVARRALEEYANHTPEEQWRLSTKELADRIKREPDERVEYLHDLSELARVRTPKT
jgi:hypothetical protein